MQIWGGAPLNPTEHKMVNLKSLKSVQHRTVTLRDGTLAGQHRLLQSPAGSSGQISRQGTETGTGQGP